MGKLLRRHNKSPDAEQLLTPRKNGFFGKRNNGVRSEDPERPSKRLSTRLFKGSKREEDEPHLHPLDDSPAIKLNNMGTPKTAPPSPDLVVLARGNSHTNHHPHHQHLRSSNNSNQMDEETIMSDLTGTVSPPTGGNSMSINHASEEKASGITPPIAQGVTFADGTPHRSDSFYSSYSPAMGVFRTNSGHVVNVGSEQDSYANPPSSKSPPDQEDDYCKNTMLDQVLKVVDGACQRSMDMTIGASSRSWAGRTNTGTSTREWGTAPSADDDESTCLNTRADTFVTRDTSTFAPRTRDGYTCGSTPTGTLCTGGSSYYGSASLRDDTMATNTVATPHSAPQLENDGQPLDDGSLKLVGTLSLAEAPQKPVESEPSVLHENFELVLGQTYGEEEKKEEVIEPTIRQDKGEPAQFSPSAVAAKQASANSPIPSKEEQREALFQSVFGDDFTKQDVGVEVQSRKVMRQQEQERLVASKRAESPSPKKRLSGLVKRLRFGKVRRSKSTSSVPRRSKSTSSIPRGGNKAAAQKTPTSPLRAPKKLAVSSPLPPKPPKTPAPTTSLPKAPATAPAKVLANAPAKAPAKAPVKTPATNSKKQAKEEEKQEIDPPLDTTFITDNTTAQNDGQVVANVVKNDDKTPRKSNLGAAPTTVKPVRSEIKKMAPKPGPLKDLRSNSFHTIDDVSDKETPEPKSTKTSGAKTNNKAEATADLESPAEMTRLRSAPVKISEEEARKKAREETDRRKPPKLTWKAATDDQGRTYFYHRETRKTTWVKPPEYDLEIESVKKYKEDMEAAKKEASETQEVIDGFKSVEAIRAQLRKKTKRDFDPRVWQTKQEILDIVQSMPLPQGTNIEKLLVQYDGREEQLLANLRDLVESKPFDEPFQAPATPKPADPVSRTLSSSSPEFSKSDSNLNISHASSSVSSSALHAVDVQHRIRTAVSSTTRVSEKTYLTEKTEKVRNTSNNPGGAIGTISEADAMSTGSISSAANHSPARGENVPFNSDGRVPSKIPAVPRSRDLKVEEFANDRIAKETYNGEYVVPPTTPTIETVTGSSHGSDERPPSRRPSADGQFGPKAVAEQIVALSSLDDDDDSYNGDYEETVDDRGDDTASEKVTDSISALSEADVDYLAQKENFERARRRALDVAVEREDWDLAAALSEGMKQVKESLYGKPTPQREWTQTELDRFISENDWDAVSKYIAHMRDHPSTASGTEHNLSHLSAPRVRDPVPGRDPDGYSASKRVPALAPSMDEMQAPTYVSEASKRAASHTQRGRRKQQLNNPSGSVASSQSSSKRAQTRFGARSQLQHSDLTSISSWGDSSSSYDSEYTDNSYESEDEQGYISLRVRRNEFEC